jgi:hypothetical protein
MAAMAYQVELLNSIPGVSEKRRELPAQNNNIIDFIHLCNFLTLQKCSGFNKGGIKNIVRPIKIL